MRWVAAAALAALAFPAGASAYWTSPSAPGGGQVTAAKLPAVGQPAASAAGSVVTISWTPPAFTGAVLGYEVLRYPLGGGAATAVGCTPATGTGGNLVCTDSPAPDGRFQYTVRTTLASWRGPESPASNSVEVDTTPPTSNLSLTAVSGGAYLSGSTLFYRGVGGGSFQIRNAVADGGSGPASSTTSTLTAAGWTHTGTTVSSPSGGPYVSAPFSWAARTTSSPTETITSADAAGNTSTDTLTFSDDSVAPTVSASVAPLPNAGGWNNTAVTVSLSASDNAGGSGIASIVYTTDGSDPRTSPTAQTYTSPVTVATSTSLAYAALDNVGNQSAVGTQPLQIDTSAPQNSLSLTGVTGGAYLAGATLYYRGVAAGSFSLANALSDTGSGPASSSSALAGDTTGWSHAASTVTKASKGVYVSNPFSWSAGTTSAPVATITGADAAGNSATASITLVDDSSAPTGTIDFPAAAASYGSGAAWSAGCSGTAAGGVCGTATDSGAGVGGLSLVLTRASDGKCWDPVRARFQPSACSGVQPTAFSAGAWTLDFPCAVDSYTLDVTVTDNVGNSGPLARRAWQITSCA